MSNINQPIPYKLLHQFVVNLLEAVGVDAEETTILAHGLMWTELIGRSNHALLRIPAYLKRFQAGLVTSPCQPKWTKKSDTIYMLDGNNGFGLYLGHLAMLKAIELAKQHGVGIVGVHHSNHSLASAYYVELAAQQGQLGLMMTNTFPRVAPHGGATAVFGTNPFAFGAPLRNKESILVDFSTSALAGGTVRQAIAENRNLPPGLAVDEDGRDIVDPVAVNQGTILPFGGAKGFCLGLMVEIFSSVITGAAISQEVASFYKNLDRPANIGHFFMALNIETLMPLDQYHDRMDMLIAFIKAAKLREGVEEILVPGETRWRTYKKQIEEGVTLTAQTKAQLTDLAHTLNINPPF